MNPLFLGMFITGCQQVKDTLDDVIPDKLDVVVELLQALYGVEDSTPDPTGEEVYFVSSEDSPGLYRVADGEPELLADGFISPTNLVTDGISIWVADPGSDSIYRVPVAGGAPELVFSGYSPTALNLDPDGVLYFSGESDSGEIGIFSLREGQPQLEAAGFHHIPTGIVLDGAGVLYAAGMGSNSGEVYEVVDGAASAIAAGLSLGSPAGIALSPDDGSLLISALSEDGHSQVVIADLATLELSIFDDGISQNTASGGLHRAKDNPEVYSWADRTSGVYGLYF